MIYFITAVLVVSAFIVGRTVGRSEVSELAWSLLEDNPSRSMVAAFLLYTHNFSITLRKRTELSSISKAYDYLKEWEKSK